MRAHALPSEQNIEDWSKALRLSGADEQAFKTVGYLVRSHESIQNLVADLRRKV